MRIKKIFALLLCALMTIVLVSCADQEIGSYLPNYDGYKPEAIEEVELELYIVVGDETASNAIITIQEAISKHTLEKYHTKVKVNYVKAADYDTTVVEAVNTGKADIVLITGTALMNTFTEAGKLVDLAAYLETTDFGKLNTQISSALLEGAYDAEGALYAIPNDHIIGSYEYITINTAIAQGAFNFNDERLAAIDTPEEADAFWQYIEANKASYPTELKREDVIKQVTGNYQDRYAVIDSGWVCNVYLRPAVDADEVNSSAFAITSSCAKPDRAMEIVYAINSDTTLRNLLQYGEEGKNYVVDENGYVVPVESGKNVYRMNILHTGDMFNALYTESDVYSFKFNEEIKNYGELQNDDAVIITEE